MEISEHLIENALDRIASGCGYDCFMETTILKEQAKQVGISLTDLWYMTQYIYYTYKPHIEMEIKERYGYDIDEEELKNG